MPTVALYGGQKIDEAPLPGARLTAAKTPLSEGAGIAEAQIGQAESIGRIGAMAEHLGTTEYGRIQEEERNHAADLEVIEAQNKLSTFKNHLTFDHETGFLNVKGKDAQGLPESVSAQYLKASSDIAGGLSSNRAREKFALIQAREGQELDLTVQRHVYEQRAVYEKETLSSLVENKRNDAIMNAADPHAVGQAISDTVDAIHLQRGIPPEQMQHEILSATSALHKGVVEALVAQQQPAKAQAYFDAAKEHGQVDGADLIHLEQVLERGHTVVDAQKLSDAVQAEGGGQQTLQQMIEKVKARSEGKTRDEAIAYLKEDHAVAAKAADDADKALLNQAYATVNQTGSTRAIDTATQVKLAVHMPGLEAFAREKQKGVPTDTNWPVYYAHMQQAANEPEKFATQNLLSDKYRLGDAEFKQLTEIQGAIVKGDRAAAGAAGLDGFRTNEQLLTDSLHQYGFPLKPAEMTQPQVEAVAELRRRMDRDMAAQEQLTGKKPTMIDKQQALDHILSQSKTVPGSWWALVGMAPHLSDQTTRVVDIPMADRQQIETSLRAKGKPITDALVLQVYTTAHGGK